MIRTITGFALIAALCVAIGATVYAADAATQTVIETQVDGEFEGWEGETVVKLMNGQIWIQSEYHYEYHYAYMPAVLIYQSHGQWKMRIEGTDAAVGVERIR